MAATTHKETKELLDALGRQQRQLEKLADQHRAAWDTALHATFATIERIGEKAILTYVPPSGEAAGDDSNALCESNALNADKEYQSEMERQTSGHSEASRVSGEDSPDNSSPPGSPNNKEDRKKSRNKDRKDTKDTDNSKGVRKGTMNNLLEGHEIVVPKGSDLFLQKIKQYLDHIAGGLVLLNSLLLMVQLELEGRQLATPLGLPGGDNFDDLLPVFQVMDTIFVFVFLVELLIRIAAERWQFPKDVANWLDFILVAGGLVDLALSLPATGDPSAQDMTTLRFVSALKAFRAIRMVRSFRFSPGLRMLVKACQCCLPSLCWSMLLLAVFMFMGALILGNLLQDFIKDEAQTMEDRRWIWERYGTTYRATYTLYEITFAGNWPTNVRPVLDKVSHAFVIFYLLYITVIVFAVIRVISAIFLKDTLDEANNDAQHLVLDRMKKRAMYVDRLTNVFHAIIAGDDGTDANVLTEKRLTEILADPKVKAYFSTLEIDITESAALFNLLDNGDGYVTLEEFINGIMRCKGTARAIDTFALQSDVKSLDEKLRKLIRMVENSQASLEEDKQHKKLESPWENPSQQWGIETRLTDKTEEQPDLNLLEPLELPKRRRPPRTDEEERKVSV